VADRGLRISWLDRVLIGIAPRWGQRRIEARARVQLMARHYEAAQIGRRTSGWQRTSSDANIANGPALLALRELSRDLRRNNGWAKRGVQVITNNTVGWGILPKAKARPNHASGRARAALELWNDWADTTKCDYDGRLNFYGLQRLAMETIAESGEVLILRQPAATSDELSIPMRLQVLEPDYLDLHRNGVVTAGGGQIIDGIEFDKQGRRIAYWLYTSHPGSARLSTTQFASVRVPADRVLHIYRVDRPGQVRGVPWLSAAITRLKGLDEFEDAELLKQKVAACFGAFVTDLDGTSTPALGTASTATNGAALENLEPGTISYLKPGQNVEFATPPSVQDGAFSVRGLRYCAVSIGVPYEELTGDYSQVNYSSARMSRIAHWQNVTEWREHMLIPLFCGGVWAWAMELVVALEGWPAAPSATWAAPPMAILEPDKEGLAYLRLVRIGAMTWGQMVRQLGYDPMEQLDEIQEYNAALDERGIVLDSDPRKMTTSGQQQVDPASSGGDGQGTADGADAARAATLIASLESALAKAKKFQDHLRTAA
jgi:lambda family phage portal protein